MKEITLTIGDEDYKKLEEIQAYMGWELISVTCNVALSMGINEVAEIIKFDKENKGK